MSRKHIQEQECYSAVTAVGEGASPAGRLQEAGRNTPQVPCQGARMLAHQSLVEVTGGVREARQVPHSQRKPAGKTHNVYFGKLAGPRNADSPLQSPRDSERAGTWQDLLFSLFPGAPLAILPGSPAIGRSPLKMDWPSLHWPFYQDLFLDQGHVIWNKKVSGEPPVHPKSKMLSQIPEAEAQKYFHLTDPIGASSRIIVSLPSSSLPHSFLQT